MLFKDETMTVSEAVRQLTLQGYEISASQIRKLSNMGLIQLNREDDQRRELSGKDLEKLEIILNLRFIGLSLNSIKTILPELDYLDEERELLSSGEKRTLYENSMSSDDEYNKARDEVGELKYAMKEINRRFDNHIKNVQKIKELLEGKASILYRE